jgi:hypothetical protein
MTIIKITQTLAIVVLAGLLTACASTPNKEKARAGEVFDHSLEVTHAAAVDALSVLGFKIEKEEPRYLEGSRPHKVGLVVGSGGETIGVWLDPVAENRTEVRVKTTKSFVGMAGQKSWDREVIAEIIMSLNKTDTKAK